MSAERDTSIMFNLLSRVNEMYEREVGEGEEAERFKEQTRRAWELAMDRPVGHVRRPRVFIGIPHYDAIHPDAFGAAAANTTDNFLDVSVRRHPGSLLCQGFNKLLSECFNEGGWDLFCLLHADVVPRIWKQPPGHGFWLDVMVRDMYGNDLDVLHVPTAIKDARGLVSTALGRKDHDARWMPVKKLSVRELKQLPKVFTLRDCERKLDVGCFGSDELCLLPNTGCLLARVDRLREHRFSGFAFLDEMQWTPDGKAHACTVPEDWNFGRWCASAGLKVGGTLNLATTHVGPHGYVSDQEWGWQLSEYGGQPVDKVF